MDPITISNENVPLKGKKRTLNSKVFIFSVFNIATFLEYFNLQFLPSSMRALEMSLALSSKDITNFSMAENLGLVVFIPVWGALCDKIELKYIVLTGVICSGIISVCLSSLSNFTWIMILRVLNGAMMGSVTPSTQKFIVSGLQNHFAIGFGILHSVMCLARMVSSLIITKFSTEVYFDIFGWRICLFGFGVTTLVLSSTLLLIPGASKFDGRKVYELTSLKEKTKRLFLYLFHMVKESLNSMTSILIVFLTYFSDGPFIAFNYVTLLIQYMGLSNLKSGMTSGLAIIGGIAGGIIGGLVSDKFDGKWPKHGLLGFVRIVTFIIAFVVINIDTVKKLYPLLAICLFVNGMTFMTVSCVDRSVLAKVVMPSVHSSSISVVRCLAGVASVVSFNPILAKLNEGVFGFQPTSLDVSNMPPSLLKNNSEALRKSISILSLGTTGVVLILYIALHFTYARDCEKIRKRIELESRSHETMQLCEV